MRRPPGPRRGTARRRPGRLGGTAPFVELAALLDDSAALFEYSESVLATSLGKLLVRADIHYTFEWIAGLAGPDAPDIRDCVRCAEARTAELRARHGDVMLQDYLDLEEAAAGLFVRLRYSAPLRPRIRVTPRDVIGDVIGVAVRPESA